MKTKSFVIILLLMFLGSIVVAGTVNLATSEYSPVELLEETAEIEGSESIDELKLFHDQALMENHSNKPLQHFSETTVFLKTIRQGLYRPPKFS